MRWQCSLWDGACTLFASYEHCCTVTLCVYTSIIIVCFACGKEDATTVQCIPYGMVHVHVLSLLLNGNRVTISHMRNVMSIALKYVQSHYVYIPVYSLFCMW